MSSFRPPDIVHVKRETNSAAHYLAQEAVTHIVNSV